MKGFLMYHVPRGRLSFVDELYVQSHFRKQNVAKSLFAAISGGPIELIVDKKNANAIALYTSLGFCNNDKGIYEPGEDEFCMKTTSFKRTRAKLASLLLQNTRTYTWQDLSEVNRESMIEGLRTAWGGSRGSARRSLRVTDSSIRYVIVE